MYRDRSNGTLTGANGMSKSAIRKRKSGPGCCGKKEPESQGTGGESEDGGCSG
jgi:hypothetical protein